MRRLPKGKRKRSLELERFLAEAEALAKHRGPFTGGFGPGKLLGMLSSGFGPTLWGAGWAAFRGAAPQGGSSKMPDIWQ